MINKFITKEDKPFFIGLLVMNIVLIAIVQFCFVNPPEFIKKPKYKNIERKHENSK